jgi:uncharacterized protein (TIGR03437 family)
MRPALKPAMGRERRILAGTLTRSLFFAVFLMSSGKCGAEIQNIVVTSAATFEFGLPVGGGMAAVFVRGINVQGIVVAQSLPLPRTLAGVSVTIDGASAPIYAVAAGEGFQQINVQVPYNVFSSGPVAAEIVVEQAGLRGLAWVPIRYFRFGEFFFFPNNYYGIFQHAKDYSLVTRENPAVPGECVIVYMAGLPQTEPVVAVGEPSPFEPLAVLTEREGASANDYFWLIVGGEKVKPGFIGLTPGQVGLYQINFIVPESLPNGETVLTFVYGRCRAMFGGGCFPGYSQQQFSSNPVLLPVRK